MSGRRSRWGASLVVVAAVAVTVWVTYLTLAWPPEPPGPASATETDPAPASEPSRAGDRPSAATDEGVADDGATVVVVVGDSFTSGTDENTGPEWPTILSERLDWDVRTVATPRSGYLADDDAPSFGERLDGVVDQAPDLVLLAGGVSDVREEPDDVAAAAEDVVLRLQDAVPGVRLVMLSPFSNGDPGPLTTALDERLAQVAASLEVPYVDVTGYLPFGADLIGDDGVHPSDKGHRRIAERLAADLREADLVS